MNAERSVGVAYLAPFFLFLGFLMLVEGVKTIGEGYSHWALAQPSYWVFPIQTIVCGALVWKLSPRIEFRPLTGFGFATIIGLLALVIWVLPQEVFGPQALFGKQSLLVLPARTDGFDPYVFGTTGWPCWTTLILRLIRMSVVVPLVEEIFWRGFLLRFLVNEDFARVPFGTFTWRSFLIGSFAFALEHNSIDWVVAIITGALFNLVAYRTRSLAACVLTHAVTNLALAFYILRTGQWGFW